MGTLKKLKRKQVYLGTNSQQEQIGTDESLRPEHIVFYGTDTRSRERLMIELAREAVKQKGGATFVVETPYLAGALYMILKSSRKKRNVVWLNPEHSLGIKNQGLWLKEYDEMIFDKYVFNYQAEIESNSLVIIDMETLKYGEKSIRMKQMLLKHLTNKLAKAELSKHFGHDVYIETLEGLEHEIKPLIMYGPSLNCGARLLAETPKLFGSEEPVVASYFRHALLLPQFNVNDAPYYKNLLGINDDKILFGRAEDVALFLTRSKTGERKLRKITLYPHNNEELSSLLANGKRVKYASAQEFFKQEEENNRILELKNTEIADNGDWRQSAQILTSVSQGCIPKHPDMLKEEEEI